MLVRAAKLLLLHVLFVSRLHLHAPALTRHKVQHCIGAVSDGLNALEEAERVRFDAQGMQQSGRQHAGNAEQAAHCRQQLQSSARVIDLQQALYVCTGWCSPIT